VTRLGIISDVHADVHAVHDALARIDRMACDVIVCAGDIVDYGLFPEETIALLRERRVPCIRGNHDRWAVGRGRADAPEDTGVPVHDASGFDLSSDAIKFLASLPTRWDAVPDGVRVAARHATPKSDMEGIDPRLATGLDARRWLAEAEADVLVVGHTHVAFALQVAGGGLIVNPGALLRDPAHRSEPGAMLFDPDTGKSVPAPPLEGGTFGVLALPAKKFTVYRASDGVEVDILRIDAPETRPER
jgi:predicted phosphodiesterase